MTELMHVLRRPSYLDLGAVMEHGRLWVTSVSANPKRHAHYMRPPNGC